MGGYPLPDRFVGLVIGLNPIRLKALLSQVNNFSGFWDGETFNR